MTPAHHPPASELMLYAAGSIDPGVELLIAAHCTMCASCRLRVARAEALGGEVLEASPRVDVVTSLTALMARLDDRGASPLPAPPRSRPDEAFPAPLRRFVGGEAHVPWRLVAPGIRTAPVPLESACRVFLVDFAAGIQVPAHGHTGLERGMPLRGGFTDEHGHVGTGDVSWHGGAHGHRVRVDDDSRCTCLFVSDGPIRIGGGLVSSLVDRWLHGFSVA